MFRRSAPHTPRQAQAPSRNIHRARTTRLILAALAPVLAVVWNSAATAENAPTQPDTQSEAIHHRFLEAVNSGDIDAAMDLFIDDANVWQAFGCAPNCQGKPLIRQKLEGLVQAHTQFSDVTVTTLQTSYTRWTVSRAQARSDDIAAQGVERVIVGFAMATRGPLIASIRGGTDTTDDQTRQFLASPATSPPPGPINPPAQVSEFGRFVDVGGGRRIYLECLGEGAPTVVFEGGASAVRGPASSGIWRGANGLLPQVAIQQDVGKVTRACTYDPASVALSDPRPRPSTGQADADDLHLLLHAAGIAPPYVLVGISYGGAVMRLFAGTYPDETAGVVLLDTDQALGDEEERFAALRTTPEAAARYWEAVRRGWEQSKLPTGLAGGTDLEATKAQVQAAGPLPDVPLAVLAAGIPYGPFNVPSDVDVEQREEVRYGIQADLARLTPRGALRIVDNSDHAMNAFVPDLIVGVINAVVDEARRAAAVPLIDP